MTRRIVIIETRFSHADDAIMLNGPHQQRSLPIDAVGVAGDLAVVGLAEEAQAAIVDIETEIVVLDGSDILRKQSPDERRRPSPTGQRTHCEYVIILDAIRCHTVPTATRQHGEGQIRFPKPQRAGHIMPIPIELIAPSYNI
jgi:hypothetical protein